MTAPILTLSPCQKRDLWKHLLPHESLREQAAFLFCTSRTIDDRSVFIPVDMALLEPDDFATQQDDYLELTDALLDPTLSRWKDKLSAQIDPLTDRLG